MSKKLGVITVISLLIAGLAVGFGVYTLTSATAASTPVPSQQYWNEYITAEYDLSGDDYDYDVFKIIPGLYWDMNVSGAKSVTLLIRMNAPAAAYGTGYPYLYLRFYFDGVGCENQAIVHSNAPETVCLESIVQEAEPGNHRITIGAKLIGDNGKLGVWNSYTGVYAGIYLYAQTINL